VKTDTDEKRTKTDPDKLLLEAFEQNLSV